MSLLEIIEEVVIEQALNILPLWAWYVVGIFSLVVFFLILRRTTKLKVITLGTTLAGITATIGMRLIIPFF